MLSVVMLSVVAPNLTVTGGFDEKFVVVYNP
jgi:hypothetical protein